MQERAYKTNWKYGDAIPAEDMNRIEQNIKEVDEKIKILEHREVTEEFSYTVSQIGNTKKLEVHGTLDKSMTQFGTLEEIGSSHIVVTGVVNSDYSTASVALPIKNGNIISFSTLPAPMMFAYGAVTWEVEDV